MPTINSINGVTGNSGMAPSTQGNIVDTLITKKGDILACTLVGTSTSSYRIPVGQNDLILKANPIKYNGVGWESSGTGSWVSRSIGRATTTGAWLPITMGPTTTLTITANRLYVYPFFTDRAWTVSNVSIRNLSNVASSFCRIGLYNSDGTAGYPGSLVQDFGTVNTASGTGTRTIACELSLFGKYWFAFISNSNPNMTAFSSSSNEFAQSIGRPNLTSGASNYILYEDGVSSYTSALPASLASDTFTIASANGPTIFFGNQ